MKYVLLELKTALLMSVISKTYNRCHIILIIVDILPNNSMELWSSAQSSFQNENIVNISEKLLKPRY